MCVYVCVYMHINVCMYAGVMKCVKALTEHAHPQDGRLLLLSPRIKVENIFSSWFFKQKSQWVMRLLRLLGQFPAAGLLLF